MQEDDGYYGAWFAGTVREHKPKEVIAVEYEELKEVDDEDPTAPETNYIGDEASAKARPIPKPVVDRAKWGASLKVDDHVQLFYLGGWWDVVVLKIERGQRREAAVGCLPSSQLSMRLSTA